ncbi:MFS transporter [Arthrobacter sp. NPDC093139]|uniref:MFS transporter n=1 Tax=Arthrobacter sp. NPDC093139 TaxID=3363945 RepID=UPI003828CA23
MQLEQLPVSKTARRKTLISSTAGAVIEWYEFTVYAAAAALVFGPMFFPSLEPGVGLIASLATFGVGFAARPIGAVVSGHLGDSIGRKSTLILTFSIMTAATAGIGLIPTYAQIGIGAPILLCILRFAQGFAVGGEWGGAAIIAVENAPKGKRGFYGSWPQIGPSTGLLLGTAAITAASALTGDQFVEWGWRVPFLASIVLTAVGLWIRLSAQESPAFLEQKKRLEKIKEHPKTPIVELFKSNGRALLITIFARGVEAGNYYLFTVFVLSYLQTNHHVPREYGLVAVMIGAACTMLTIPIIGAISDRLGRKRVFLCGGFFVVIFAWPLLEMIGTGHPVLITLGVTLFLVLGNAVVYAPLASFYCELYPTKVRYSGISIGYQTMSVFLSGATPVFAAWLIHVSNGSLWSLALLASGSALLGVIAVCFAPETKNVDLDAVEPLPWKGEWISTIAQAEARDKTLANAGAREAAMSAADNK